MERRYSNWILVGGTGRNIGKTTAAEQVIKKLSREVSVIGVKVSKILPDELSFHGSHDLPDKRHFLILEEKDVSGKKDSMRFLRAGARKSYFIVAEDEFLEDAFLELEKLLCRDDIVVCESNGLRNFVIPSLFIMIQSEQNSHYKKNLGFLLESADVILQALNTEALMKLVERIGVEEGKLTVREV